jgi:hypothetical protein
MFWKGTKKINIEPGPETTTTSGGYVRNSPVSDYEGEAGIETRLSQHGMLGNRPHLLHEIL